MAGSLKQSSSSETQATTQEEDDSITPGVIEHGMASTPETILQPSDVCCEPEHHSLDKIAKVRTVPARKYEKLEEELERVNGLVGHYQAQCRMERIRMDEVSKECQDRIAKVSHFWKEKIYREGSRSGIIVKRAMQKPNKT